MQSMMRIKPSRHGAIAASKMARGLATSKDIKFGVCFFDQWRWGWIETYLVFVLLHMMITQILLTDHCGTRFESLGPHQDDPT